MALGFDMNVFARSEREDGGNLQELLTVEEVAALLKVRTLVNEWKATVLPTLHRETACAERHCKDRAQFVLCRLSAIDSRSRATGSAGRGVRRMHLSVRPVPIARCRSHVPCSPSDFLTGSIWSEWSTAERWRGSASACLIGAVPRASSDADQEQ